MPSRMGTIASRRMKSAEGSVCSYFSMESGVIGVTGGVAGVCASAAEAVRRRTGLISFMAKAYGRPVVARKPRPSGKGCRSPRDGIPVNHPQPRSILLAPRNLRGHGAITAARRREGQITANERWSLFSELELSLFRSKPRNLHFGKELVNGLFATQERSTANVDYRVWLEQRRHASNISRVLSRDQQSLQILGIVGRLSCRQIIQRTLLQLLCVARPSARRCSDPLADPTDAVGRGPRRAPC